MDVTDNQELVERVAKAMTEASYDALKRDGDADMPATFTEAWNDVTAEDREDVYTVARAAIRAVRVADLALCKEAELPLAAAEPIFQFFSFDHLPQALADISRPFHDIAVFVLATLPRNAERTTALRKLLEAKDCAVRAKLFKSAESPAH